MLRCRLLTFGTIVALTFLTVPASSQDWAGRGRAHGSVKDPQGNPLEGVKVKLHMAGDPDSGPEPVYTNKKGRWAVGGLAGGGWTVLLDLEGYMPSQGAVQISEFDPGEPIDVVLEPNPFASIGVGDTLLESGQYAAARAEYEKALPLLEPAGAARLRSRIGDTYLAEGNYDAARREYEAALPHIEPGEQAHIRLQMANSYQAEERFDEARAEYEKVLPLLDPDGQVQVLATVARSYDVQDNRDQAIATLERALEIKPGDAVILPLIADLLTRAGREVEAQQYLAQLPDDAELPADMVLNIGIRFYNDGDMDQAYEYFNRAVSQNPNLAETYYYRGLVRLSRSENDLAKADFLKLLELEPDTPRKAEVQEFLDFLE